MARNLPVLDDDDLETAGPTTQFQRRLDRRARNKQRDLITVGVLTPAVLVGLLVGVLVLTQAVYPDTYVDPTAVPQPTAGPAQPTPTPVIVLQPIDTARLNAGIVEKPPTFEWPEISDLKGVPNPGRPNEQSDYTPNLSAVDVRRLIAVTSVNVTLHSSSAFASGAAEEIAKAYPLRAAKRKVVDVEASTGYVPDDSTFGVVFVLNGYRIQVETVAATPPFRPAQRNEVEALTLHVADHILRRAQEVQSGATRTGPEASAVHLRDHIGRWLPGGN
jgi:hypothetical protein